MSLVLALLLATAFDVDMSSDEMKKTGLAKLSAREKRALTAWIETRYSKKTLAADAVAPKPQSGILEENLKSGHYIRLSDKSLWEIKKEDTPITQGWITAVEIKVTPSGDPDYPYTLTNSLTGSSVRAKPANQK